MTGRRVPLQGLLIAGVVVLAACAGSPLGAEEAVGEGDSRRQVPSYLHGEEAEAARLYREVLPAVVTIYASRPSLGGAGEEDGDGSVGSGVIISPERHVLTAAHVVRAADEIVVKTHDGQEVGAELLFSESNADIALIQLTGEVPGSRPARLGDSDRLAVGQLAYAIGSPYGLENSFSVGRISGFREFDRLYDGVVRAEFIQTDAAINVGNSGGPLFNSNGEVIGITSRIVTVSGGFQGLGFVVAINTAKQLLALEDRVWLGVEVSYLSAAVIEALWHRQADGGLLITRVVHGSPADKAGLHGGTVPMEIDGRDYLLGGDVIIEFAAQKVCNSDCLIEVKQHLTGLDRIPVKFLRGGRPMETVIDVSQSRRNFLQEY